MHPSSLINMKRARDLLSLTDNLKILDVGGRGLTEDNRSYYNIWKDKASEYLVSDICEGPGVTHVMKGPYDLPFEDEYFDLIVSGQTLEHVFNPFRLIAEMKRVLRTGCCMIIIVPSEGKDHDLVDCWRYKRDSFKAIAEETDLTIVADWIDTSAPDNRSRQWADHVFIGRK